jgi:TPP-dependent pyruvate/acetoin dehydrogenase alpha subunit
MSVVLPPESGSHTIVPRQSSGIPLCDRASSVEALYAQLVAIRTFEESLLAMFGAGVLAGTTHTCLGQEATAVGVISALDRDRDIVVSNHRGHGHFLAYCGEAERLYLEVMGKPGGVCGGRGGSQHLYLKNFYSNGILGGTVPVATGMALAEKLAGSGAVTAVFLGDGTLGEGVVYESFNFASLWSLPILFVLENNGYAQSTPYQLQVAGSMKARPEAFGIETEERRTTDAQEIRAAASDLVDSIRREVRPRCLLIHDYRLGPHSKGDDTRPAAEIEEARTRDPLRIGRAWIDAARAAEIEREVSADITQAKERALAAPVHER